MPEQKADVEVDFAVRLPRSRIDHDSLFNLEIFRLLRALTWGSLIDRMYAL